MNIKDYPKTIPQQEQYSAGEVAILFGISHRTACRLLDEGQIASHRIPGGRERRVLHETIVRYAEDHPEHRFILDKIVSKEPS